MAIPKILLYYIFTPLADPEAVRLWQRDLCAGLGLRGRILISKDGLNGTVGGDLPAVKKYIRKTRDYAPFRHIDFKWSEGTGLDGKGQSRDFPRLVVKVRDEIVSFGAPGELRVNTAGVVGGGTKLAPAELNALVAARGDDVVFFDGRNKFEAEIGHFRNAVVPDVANTREFVAELDSGKYDHLKGKPVVTYCTGGIRCEVLSGLMKSRGFGEVYQLDGGIVRYGEAFGNEGLWSGSLYVFDQRMSIDFAPDAAIIGTCQICAAPTTNMLNCRDSSCREQLVVCAACVAAAAPTCTAHASEASAPAT
ncbi:rhodanese-related sulfurtransferase [Cryobacterium ruanii]|uniref:tRNA uridine(34) hydroxylase n=1 Tax=Cryobacterium ruanii TaxID=1259197 RepID=A0A4V3IT60_9MICO|nr:rhodanese-related sulfurtransferase [Cryobacterium ruanii]TFD64185.1 rhodanese-related sulfurtransferase [Cryobacterium ruanii]